MVHVHPLDAKRWPGSAGRSGSAGPMVSGMPIRNKTHEASSLAACATCAHAGPRVVRKPTLRWLPSQNGLLADAPHLHSATRVSCLTSVWS